MDQSMTAGIESLPAIAQRMAEYGRGGDRFLAHLAPDETVIPRQVLDAHPRLRESLFEHMRQMGVDPDRYIVGSDRNSINPATGLPEFDFIRDLQRGLKDVFKAAAPVVLPFVVGSVFPNLGPVLSGALGAGVGSLLGGGKPRDALKMAAIGGVAGGVFSGLKAGFGGTEGTFGSRFTEGVAQPFRDLGASITNTMQSPFTAVQAQPVAGTAAPPPPAQGPGAQQQPGLFDRATKFFTPESAPSLETALKAVGATTPAAATPGQLALAQDYIKKNTPGFLANYGPLLALGGIGAYAAGAFDQPKQQPAADFFGGRTGSGLLTASPDKYRIGAYKRRLPETPALPPVGLPALAQGGAPTAFPRRTGGIAGPGTETSDSIPAMLSDGEFVMTAKAVRGAGNGSRRDGMKTMYQMMRKFERNAG
jgi:hypothetical protein